MNLFSQWCVTFGWQKGRLGSLLFQRETNHNTFKNYDVLVQCYGNQ